MTWIKRHPFLLVVVLGAVAGVIYLRMRQSKPVDYSQQQAYPSPGVVAVNPTATELAGLDDHLKNILGLLHANGGHPVVNLPGTTGTGGGPPDQSRVSPQSPVNSHAYVAIR